MLGSSRHYLRSSKGQSHPRTWFWHIGHSSTSQPTTCSSPLNTTAVGARLGFGSPVVSFGAVRDSGNLAAVAGVGPNPLGLLNAIGPTCDHSDAAVLDEVLGHGRVVTPRPSGSTFILGQPRPP